MMLWHSFLRFCWLYPKSFNIFQYLVESGLEVYLQEDQ